MMGVESHLSAKGLPINMRFDVEIQAAVGNYADLFRRDAVMGGHLVLVGGGMHNIVICSPKEHS